MERSNIFSSHKWHLLFYGLDEKLSYTHNTEQQQFRQCDGICDISSHNEKSLMQGFQTWGM
jgi:hypothetical protein